VNVPYTDSHEQVLGKLKNTGAELLIIFTLNEWHGDGYNKNTEINYDVSFKVYYPEGQLLVEKTDGNRELNIYNRNIMSLWRVTL